MTKSNKILLSVIALMAIIIMCCFCLFIIVITPSTKVPTAQDSSPRSLFNTTQNNSIQPVSSEVNGITTQQTEPPPTCTQGAEKSRSCSACDTATVTYTNLDCSTGTKTVDDTTCTAACPKCTVGAETNRYCSGCNTATVAFNTESCTTDYKNVEDASCQLNCPPPPPATYYAPIDSCCKHCTNSQACGDSCISWNYTCHKGPGCACQG